MEKRALIATRLVVHLTKRKNLPQDLHKMTLTWASSICCCSITCHFELGRHKSKLFSTFSTNGNVPNNTSSFYLHLLKGALKNYLICSLTLHIIFSHCRSFLMVFTPNIDPNFNPRLTQVYCSVKIWNWVNTKRKIGSDN